ncbi:FAD-binding oxidoreductase [Flavobacteriales bacterium]|nr:FAD-binding oxidoreductase [Flavobacteriales bacterium]
MAFSYWESTEWLEGNDLIVIGGGIVGLSAALQARVLKPHWKISVIERDTFGGGGSTKNAGFACFGSLTELAHDRSVLGDDEAAALLKKRIDGLKLLRSSLGDSSIGYRDCGSLELIRKGMGYAMPSLETISEVNAWAAEATGTMHTFHIGEGRELAGINSTMIEGAIASPLEGAIDTGKMMQALRLKAQKTGIRLLFGLNVTGWNQHTANHQIEIERPGSLGTAKRFAMKAPHVVIATNAFARELIPKCDVNPKENMVLVTEAIDNLRFDGTVHMDEGHLYARNIQNRMLIGGGRHWNLKNNIELEKKLKALLNEAFPETLNATIEYQWTGVLGIGSNRIPIVSKLHARSVAAVKMGGMGVAIGMQLGKESIELLLSD